jgi:hypothetical protein
MMRTIAEAIGRHVLLADAPIARQLRAVVVDTARDLFGAEGCVAVLSLTRAKLVRALHEGQLRAGADLVRTNTDQASPLELRRFGLEEDAFAINYAAAQLASSSVDALPGEGRRRFVLGMVRDLGWEATPQEIEEASALQVSALLAGGADGIAVQIAGDGCRGPAFLRGATRARDEARSAAGIFLLSDKVGPAEGLLKLADGLIRYREIEDASGLADAIRTADLIAGATLDQTASLDRLLQASCEEGTRPPVAPASHGGARLPCLLDVTGRRVTSQPARSVPAPAGTVIFATGWGQRP